MTVHWQLAIVTLVVALAAGYLGKRAWDRIAGKKGSCGGCASCPGHATDDSSGSSFVPLEQLDISTSRSHDRY